MINIVIPMAGEGNRFKGTKYNSPKPLIEFFGKPMIQHVIESLGIQGKYHFLIRDDDNKEYVSSVLYNLLPDCNIKSVKQTTDGPACSALLFEEYINNDDELIVTNCDQIMWWDANLFLEVARYKAYDGLIVTYYTNTEKNSYARIDKKGFVTEIKEKEVISDISLNGIHYWKKGKYFVESSKRMIEQNDTAPNGEYYVGPSYNHMINYFNKKVGIYNISNFQHNSVGVPEDLDYYIQKAKKYDI